MAASLNQSVQRGRGQGLAFRTTRDGVVPSSIGVLNRLTLEPAMKAALTYANAKLVIELDAGGTRVLLADGRTGQLIGGPEDLQKLGSIRAFVNRERKDAAGVEAAKEITQLAFLSEKVVQESQPGFKMKPVDNSYGAALRPLQASLEQMFENERKLDENTSSVQREVFEPELRRLFAGIGNAYTAVISALTKGQSIKGLLQEQLFREGVPDWVATRFCSKNLILERTGELRKLLFPGDPTKGLALSLKEWRDDGFVAKQGPLLACSSLGYTLVNDDELLHAITKIADDVDLDDEANPSVAKLLKSKLTVMPPVSTADQVIELGSKSRSGFRFPTPTMDTIPGAIAALSTALLRVFSANLQSVDLVGDYYATIVPGAVSISAVTPTNNFYVQWGKAVSKDSVWLEAIKGGPKDLHLRIKLWRWLRTELRLSEAASAGKALASALSLSESGQLPRGGHLDGVVLDDAEADEDRTLTDMPDFGEVGERGNRPVARSITRELAATEVAYWEEFQRRVFSVKTGKKRPAPGLALTPLTPQSKQLLVRVKQLSPYVADRMHQWLRSFSDERLQLAAVKVTNAEFDDIFSSSLEDENEAQSEVDWAETEAP